MGTSTDHTCIISAQDEWREPDTGTWSEGAEIGFARNKGLAHTHIKK